MPKYLRQRDEISCGPVGIINVAKYYGLPLSGKDLPWIKDACQTNAVGGTVNASLYEVSQEILGEFLNIYSVRNPTWSQLKKFLSSPKNSTILGYVFYDDGQWSGHWAVLTNVNADGTIEVINDKGNTVDSFGQKALASVLRNKKYDSPYAVFFEQK